MFATTSAVALLTFCSFKAMIESPFRSPDYCRGWSWTDSADFNGIVAHDTEPKPFWTSRYDNLVLDDILCKILIQNVDNWND